MLSADNILFSETLYLLVTDNMLSADNITLLYNILSAYNMILPENMWSDYMSLSDNMLSYCFMSLEHSFPIA
jgi:hypothetical protein